MIQDRKRYEILVIEDNLGDYIIVAELLSEKIIAPAITHARDFREANAILENGAVTFNIILLDISLPDKSGKALMERMLQIAGSCPIIILTGYGDIEFGTKSISLGISDYLIKDDLNASVLYKSIIYAIERKKIVSELQESEKRFSDLFQLSPQPKWIYDCETRKIIQVNAAACEQYGYSVAEFMEMSIEDLHPKKIREELSHNPGHKHLKKSGEIIDVDIFETQLNAGGRKFTSVIAIDRTERNNFEIRLSQAIIKAQEEERYEIGSELHDNVCQILATSNIRLSMLREKVPADVLPKLKQCAEGITLASREIRRLSHKLAPAFYDFRTLAEEFGELLRSFSELNNYEIALLVDSQINKIDLKHDIKINLYRILQEQLTNIAKYAQGTAVEVVLSLQRGKLVMTIADNGVGMSADAPLSGIGFANMKRRVAMFSGRLMLESPHRKGFKVSVEIPLGDYAPH